MNSQNPYLKMTSQDWGWVAVNIGMGIGTGIGCSIPVILISKMDRFARYRGPQAWIAAATGGATGDVALSGFC
jgi:hypothetical protein